MAVSKNLFNKTFLIISLILLVLVAGAIFYFTYDNYPADAVAVIDFNGEQLVVEAQTIANIEKIAAAQNVTLDRALVIERLAQLEVLRAQAIKLGIAPTQEQVDTAFDQQVATLEQQGLQQALIAQNVTRFDFEADLRNSIIEDLTLQLLFNEEVVKKLQISDEELKAYYDENPSRFFIPESVLAKHILICYAGAISCSLNLTQEQAQQSIIAIYQALQNNASFEELASQYSSDTVSAQQGGDLGQIARGQTVTEFDTAAFATNVGTYSLPFESSYGYHIVAVYGKQAAQQLTFEQVSPQIKQQLILQQANSLQQAYITGLMSSATVTVVG